MDTVEPTSARPRAAIVVTGSELLTGTIADRNGPWLANQLTDLGFQVGQLFVVGDRPVDLADALAYVADCALVVTSGGLGPTADDLTVECVARFVGVPLELDPGMYSLVGRIVAEWARLRGNVVDGALEAGIRKQAMLPVGALALPPVGTAPGLVLRRPGGPLVVVLPGPPTELQGMWPSVLSAAPVADLLTRVPAAAAHSLRFFGLPEPVIAQTLRELDVPADVEVTTCLRRSELEVDIRPAPGLESRAADLADAIVARHRDQLVSADGTTTDESLARALLERGWFVATAESCTGGMVAARLTERPGASAFVAGGTVAYSNEAKVSQLDVAAETLAAHGAVSPQVARELADGARQRFGAAIGVGITGIAGPDGGTASKPVGYVCLCVTTDDGTVLARDPVLPGSRAQIRERATDLALQLLWRASRR
jgi:nicotinamide-nucleotide amidase